LNETVDYYISDLTASTKRKILLVKETKTEIIDIVSFIFKKPLFKIYIKNEEKHLLSPELNCFNFKPWNPGEKFNKGDFLLQIEEVGEL